MNTIIKQKSRLRLIAVAAGCLFLSGSVAMAQAVRQDTPEASAPNAAPISVTTQPVTASSVDDDVILMSPFQVDATKEKGYFAENTLAGSRMRTNIADLGAAITVVTKQQLEDTASLDVNDVFRYELGTEGSTTFTPSVLTSKGDGPADVIAGASFGTSAVAQTNATANRVRGLGSPSFALNYYQAIALVPFDSYNASSVEINRGANSMLFGMGSPAGIVNLSMAQAEIGKNRAQVQIRIDNRGSERVSLSFNKTLLADKLALYGALLYNDQQFERKPSYDITRRQYGAITYKPFKRTKITASIEGYNNDNNRPNSYTPIDGVSVWRNAGSPYYDDARRVIVRTNGEDVPVAYSSMSPNAEEVIAYIESKGHTVERLHTNTNYPDLMTGAQITNPLTGAKNSIFGGLPAAYTTYGSPLYIPSLSTYASSRLLQSIVNGNLSVMQVPAGYNPRTGWNGTSALTDSFTTSYGAGTAEKPYIYDTPYANIYSRLTTYGGTANGNVSDNNVNGLYAYTYPGVIDSSVYDWRHVNTLQMNYGRQRNTTYNIEIEQEIIPNLLHFSAGWFRQDFDSITSYTVSQQNSAYLYVDTDKYTTTGELNPNFGKTYLQDYDPDRFEQSITTDQYRAMLAFTPDFTKNKNWTKWLGHHQILGLASYYDQEEQLLRRRLAYIGGDALATIRYKNNTVNPGWAYQSNATTIRRYYLSSEGNNIVNQSSGKIDSLDDNIYYAPIQSFDYQTGQYMIAEADMYWNVFNDNASSRRNARQLTSYSGAWTAYLWDDRVIATAGVRRDINRTRNDNDSSFASNMERYVDGYYQYWKKPWTGWSRIAGTTSTLGAVVRPFTGWEFIEKRAGDSLLWEFVRNFGISYNKSDNFDAPVTTNTDFFGTVLPKPQGKSKDYGVQVSLFKDKLFARVTWFESTNENAIMGGATGTAISRLKDHMDTTAYRSWLSTIYMLADGADPADPANDSPEGVWYAPYVENGTYGIERKWTAMQEWVGKHWIGGSTNYKYYSSLTIGSTGTYKSKGTEVAIQYNPLPNWTLKFNASKNTTVTSNVLKELLAWEAARMQVWDTADAGALFDELAAAGISSSVYTKAQLTSPDGISLYNVTDRKMVLANNGNYKSDFWASHDFRDTNGNATTISATNHAFGWYTAQDYYDKAYTPFKLQGLATEGQEVADQRKYNVSFLTNYNFDRGALKGWAVGGAQRYASKAIIGYKGKSSGNNKDLSGKALLDMIDVNSPVYDDAVWYTDLWVSYTRKIFNDKVRMKLQLNVADVFENGGLRPTAVNYDGTPYAYRIMDPRTFILTATFDF
jgi:outer membrane receptor protein involved in Fe transport